MTSRRSWRPYALLALVALVMVEWRFSRSMPTVLYGDDLDNFLAFEEHGFASSFGQALSGEYFQRYRPTWAVVMWVLYSLVGTHVSGYLIFNTLAHVALTWLTFCIGARIAQGRATMAFAIATAAASSRFGLYEVTQVTGIVESLSFLFCLVGVYAVVRMEDPGARATAWGWCAVGAAFLSMHAHERYVVLSPWLLLAFLSSPAVASVGTRRRAQLLIGAVAPLLFNYAYKVVVLRMPFFVGTSETRLEVTPSVMRALSFEAVSSLIGWNRGPTHLVGAEVVSLGWTASTLAAMFAGGLLLSLGVALWRAARRSPAELRWPLLLLAGSAALLVAPVLSIRLEQRWLLGSYVLVLLGLAWSTRWLPEVRGSALVLTSCCAAIGVDALVSPYFENVFFVGSGRFAEVAKRRVADPNPGDLRDVAFIASPSHCAWSLLEGKFFMVYGGARRSVHCFEQEDEQTLASLPAGTPVYRLEYGERRSEK